MQQVQSHSSQKTASQHRTHALPQADVALSCSDSGVNFATLLVTPETAPAEKQSTISAEKQTTGEKTIEPAGESIPAAPAVAPADIALQKTDAALFMLAATDAQHPATPQPLAAETNVLQSENPLLTPRVEPEGKMPSKMPALAAGVAASGVELPETPRLSALPPPGVESAPQGALQTFATPVPTIPISAPPAAAAVIPGAAIPLDSVPLAIAAQVHEGARRFEIRLDPAELGRVDIRLDIDADGSVRAHLIVERPGTLQHLQQDAPRLEQALASAGASIDQGGLSFSLKQEQSEAPRHHARQEDPVAENAASQTHALLPAPHRLPLSAHLDLLA